MQDAQAETTNIFEQLKRETEERKRMIQAQIAQNLGPSSATADQSYIAGLVEGGGNKGRDDTQEATQGYQQLPSNSSHHHHHHQEPVEQQYAWAQAYRKKCLNSHEEGQ